MRRKVPFEDSEVVEASIDTDEASYFSTYNDPSMWGTVLDLFKDGSLEIMVRLSEDSLKIKSYRGDNVRLNEKESSRQMSTGSACIATFTLFSLKSIPDLNNNLIIIRTQFIFLSAALFSAPEIKLDTSSNSEFFDQYIFKKNEGEFRQGQEIALVCTLKEFKAFLNTILSFSPHSSYSSNRHSEEISTISVYYTSAGDPIKLYAEHAHFEVYYCYYVLSQTYLLFFSLRNYSLTKNRKLI